MEVYLANRAGILAQVSCSVRVTQYIRVMTDDVLTLRNALRTIIVRDLHGLEREIAAYPDDESLWLTPPGISNSAGNLAQHLTGNLRHFIGSVLGDTGYVRDRDAEFATKGRSRAELQEEVRAAVSELESAFDKITIEQLTAEYPIQLREFNVRTIDFLVHLAVHFGYHLGQVDYHRRMLTPNPPSANTIDIESIALKRSS